MSWAAVVIGGTSLIGAGLKANTANKQKREGKALLKEQRPEYQIPNEVTQAANEGLPSEQYRQAMQNIQRQQMLSLASAQTRRGGLSSIGGIQMLSNDAMGKLDVANAQARQQNQLRLAGYRDKAWQLNKSAPYERNYNYGMSLLGAGNQNMAGALDDAISGVSNAAYIKMNQTGGGDSSYTPQRVPRANPSLQSYR